MTTVRDPIARDPCVTYEVITPRTSRARWTSVAGLGIATVWAAWGISRRSLWLDEAFSVAATNDLVHTWRQTGGTMGLYYALLTPWSRMSIDRGWLRSLSLLVAVATLPVVFALGRWFRGRSFALVATTITAGSWMWTRYAQEARSYSLTLLLTTVGWLALVRWTDEPPGSAKGRRWRWIFGAVAVAAILSHGLAILQVAAQFLALAMRHDRRTRLRAAIPTAAGCLGVLAVLTVLGVADVASWVPSLSMDQLHDLLASFTGPSAVAQVFLGLAIALGAIRTSRAYLRDRCDPHAWRHVVIVIWAIAPTAALITISAVRPYIVPRYLLGSVPALAMLIGLGLGLDEPFDRRRVTAVIGLVAVLVAGRFSAIREVTYDWAGAARTVARQAEPGDQLAFPTQMMHLPFDYAWQELPTPSATPRVLSPSGPLGAIDRYGRTYSNQRVLEVIAKDAPKRLWVVDRPQTGSQGAALRTFLTAGALDPYQTVRREHFAGDLTVVLLVRR